MHDSHTIRSGYGLAGLGAVVGLLALLSGGCASACVPVEGADLHENYAIEYEATVQAYVEFGYEFTGAPYEDTPVIQYETETVPCGGVDAGACTWHTAPNNVCAHIALSTQAGRRTIVHEYLHVILHAHGVESSDHEHDWPDFYLVRARAHELAQELREAGW